ncbi:MAG: hypothetical protein A2270_11340 [Elusimicrobia bacterium RIFOXYA12_FULL_51_18]|nr:MAG: hypothetical protein A2270_11340 [Elusimicrobia bacterium RIFOXYA12_FULL_51_18]OGS30230.1 MAG: hypothetical protein A2218_12100 [Elusimicrobia bacterium RIFOXYA2_FULL_53_38]
MAEIWEPAGETFSWTGVGDRMRFFTPAWRAALIKSQKALTLLYHSQEARRSVGMEQTLGAGADL